MRRPLLALIALTALKGWLVATLTIRDLDDEIKAALRVRAAEHGRPMESEVREILRMVFARPVAGPGMGHGSGSASREPGE
jgi:hypothetical protein